MPKLQATFWSAILAPGGTPPSTVEKLNAAINEILKGRDVEASLSKLSATAKIGTPEDLKRFIASRVQEVDRGRRSSQHQGRLRIRHDREVEHVHSGHQVLARLAAVAPAAAQDTAKDFPSRAIHIVVPFPAGGPADVIARLIGQRMSEDWGQPVIIDNRPGGNTVIGAQQVAKAAPDGYTLLMAIDSTLVMNQYVYKIAALRSDQRFRADHDHHEDRLGAGGVGPRSGRNRSRS